MPVNLQFLVEMGLEFGFHYCNVAPPPGIELPTLRCATANGIGPIGTSFRLGGFRYWQMNSIMMIRSTSLAVYSTRCDVGKGRSVKKMVYSALKL